MLLIYMKRLDTILEKIRQQRIDEENRSYKLTTDKKEVIYHEIVKAMVENKNEYSLRKFDPEPVFKEESLQKAICIWLQKEHGIECTKKYVNMHDWHNDFFYYVAYW